MSLELKVLDPRILAWGFPHHGSALSVGLDLHACLDAPLHLAPGGPPALVSAGFALRIGDPDWCGIVAPRSGLGHRGLVLGNTIGVIDADYEGPLTLSLWNRNAAGGDAIAIEPGDRVAQLLLVRVSRPDMTIVTEFTGASGRGAGGFGSTGVRPAGDEEP
jgi:dUTP pyrophosphatase